MDHKPFTFALSSRSDRHSPRQIRHFDLISQFTTDIRHIQGTHNSVADALSRIVVNAIHCDGGLNTVIDFRVMAEAQVNDPDLTKLQSDSSLKLQRIPLALSDGGFIICDMSTGTPRPFVPECFRRPIFDSLHSLSHPGIRATQRMLTSRFVWPHINSDVRSWACTCLQCQKSKVHRHTTVPLSTFSTPDSRFDMVHIDLVGPLPPSSGKVYLLTCVDRFTRWPEAIPIADCTAETVARAFLQTWVARFGTPTQGRRLRYGCNGFGRTTFQKSISGKDRYPVKCNRDRLLCHNRMVIRVFRWLLLVKNLFYLIYLQFLTIL